MNTVKELIEDVKIEDVVELLVESDMRLECMDYIVGEISDVRKNLLIVLFPNGKKTRVKKRLIKQIKIKGENSCHLDICFF